MLPSYFAFAEMHHSCRRRDSVIPTTNPYLSLASPTKMIPSAYSGDTEDPFGAKIPTYVAAMQPTPRLTHGARIPPTARTYMSMLILLVCT